MNSPQRFAFEANIQASGQRRPSGNHQNRAASDNADYVLGAREGLILRQQTPRQRAIIVKRFLAKVHKTQTCWLWTASTMDTYGHGQFTIRDTAGNQYHLYAHRVAWVLSGRVLPLGLQLCHRCDVGRCVRPGHLFLGTQRDNLDDAIAKGRLICGLGARKLSDDAYREILTQPYERGSGIALAHKYGVHEVTVCRIRRGHSGSLYRTARMGSVVAP